MRDRLTERLAVLLARVRRVERREVRELGRWLENTNNLLHLSVVLLVPLLIGVVTAFSNSLTELSFLLFPPLASGTYTLFSDPEGRYASARKFVLGLTTGAVCGWGSLLTTGAVYGTGGGGSVIHPESAALAVFLTGIGTWALNVEEPAAFSTALLILVIDVTSPRDYVVSVVISATLVAGVFVLWRRQFYQRRARFLYGTTRGDDHVLVPLRGETSQTTALFAGRLAAAHAAGKVVLLAMLSPEKAGTTTVEAATTEAASDLESLAESIETRLDVPCEVVVATGDPVATTVETARATNCDLVVTPYESEDESLSAFVRGIFDGPFDAVAFRSTTGREQWKRILVLVARPGDSAHAMVDFASRLAGRSGSVSLCNCISREVERRPAESKLANVAETATADIETRVARSDVQKFISANADSYDLVMLGGSRDRSMASRFISPPTFERLSEVETDVAVVDRGTL